MSKKRIQEVQPIRDPEKIEEMKKCLLKKSYRDYFLFSLGINIGIRISDLLQLQVKDVRNEHDQIKQYIVLKEQKTDKNKRYRVAGAVRELIAEYIKGMDDDAYLFPSKKTKKPITRVQAYRILNDCAKECGLEEIGTHSLRKTFGYHYYKLTKDVAKLQEIFNHSSPSITKRYIGITQDEIDESLEGFFL